MAGGAFMITVKVAVHSLVSIVDGLLGRAADGNLRSINLGTRITTQRSALSEPARSKDSKMEAFMEQLKLMLHTFMVYSCTLSIDTRSTKYVIAGGKIE